MPSSSKKRLGSAPEAAGRQSRLTIQVMDLHAACEPLRLVRSSFQEVRATRFLERRTVEIVQRENADHVRHA